MFAELLQAFREPGGSRRRIDSFAAAAGRVGDEADIVEYRDMVAIVRDRVRDMVRRNLTLDQVKAARPTLDYDGRYGAESGARFVEALYRGLSGKDGK
jgi:hypothetical protein